MPNRIGQNANGTMPTEIINLGTQRTLLVGPTTVFSGQQTVTAASTATRMPGKPIRWVTISSLGKGQIYIGDGAVSDSKGYLLTQEMTLYLGQLDSLYIWSDVDDSGVYWVAA